MFCFVVKQLTKSLFRVTSLVPANSVLHKQSPQAGNTVNKHLTRYPLKTFTTNPSQAAAVQMDLGTLF